ncbi:MAG: hypothetical protein KH321_10730, partial [Clostridium sp.]|nr:hypothetical protein [Clostridium sp.]
MHTNAPVCFSEFNGHVNLYELSYSNDALNKDFYYKMDIFFKGVYRGSINSFFGYVNSFYCNTGKIYCHHGGSWYSVDKFLFKCPSFNSDDEI